MQDGIMGRGNCMCKDFEVEVGMICSRKKEGLCGWRQDKNKMRSNERNRQ